MAKTVKKEDIDEKSIIASFLQDEPTEHDALVRGNEADNTLSRSEVVREDTRRRRNREQDYETLFIREPRTVARIGKTTYIRQEFHDTIQSVCRVVGEGKVSLSGYIDNVLAHHFDTYGDEITRLYDEKHKGINILKK
ncbi:MAG: DUF3408 domain-containing protein [Alistipes sp.]|jgi:hypothetical protein|uniref:DUF3408 domain-containing protein n=1 Tax=uncultured Alistipes sp. TaxID=538949 RepID=UPI002596514A|nr:DUF3408 domain-containing protein [uncultured Alistipes sp.]MCI9244165.1 DUF3408 domain-containing protein [Alistipes sp.]